MKIPNKENVKSIYLFDLIFNLIQVSNLKLQGLLRIEIFKIEIAVLEKQMKFLKREVKLTSIKPLNKVVLFARQYLQLYQQFEYSKQPEEQIKINYPEYESIRAVPHKITQFLLAATPTMLEFQVIKWEKKYQIKSIYKNVEDLRQDLLIMQIFNLMDELPKGDNQRYELLQKIKCILNFWKTLTLKILLKNPENLLKSSKIILNKLLKQHHMGLIQTLRLIPSIQVADVMSQLNSQGLDTDIEIFQIEHQYIVIKVDAGNSKLELRSNRINV